MHVHADGSKLVTWCTSATVWAEVNRHSRSLTTSGLVVSHLLCVCVCDGVACGIGIACKGRVAAWRDGARGAGEVWRM